ncbi:MAG: hypothetical protein AVDCRST_MAG77-1745 [uncultured Chloroflexi bacterium]|uniref:Uncharacterized protein n=1 Tax=uncultured Chloroflexota bacterium TaxID=166587 RepID=A0A6J4IA47_9CHLR|nr:MAG: hypothetical protein AVDCRST_MAG77-1745 [uncultured Chloroflexota bacterium]
MRELRGLRELVRALLCINTQWQWRARAHTKETRRHIVGPARLSC